MLRPLRYGVVYWNLARQFFQSIASRVPEPISSLGADACNRSQPSTSGLLDNDHRIPNARPSVHSVHAAGVCRQVPDPIIGPQRTYRMFDPSDDAKWSDPNMKLARMPIKRLEVKRFRDSLLAVFSGVWMVKRSDQASPIL